MKICKQFALRGIRLAATVAAVCGIASGSSAAVQRICPAAGGGPSLVIVTLDGGTADCWTGSDWAHGTTWSRGAVQTTSGSGRSVGAYAFWGLEHTPPTGYSGYALTVGYNSSNVWTCTTVDGTGDGTWVNNTASSCNNTAYATVEAWTHVIS